MKTILSLIEKSDKYAFVRWGVNKNIKNNENSIDIPTKIGDVKVKFNANDGTYEVIYGFDKINGLFYDQIVETIDKLMKP